MCTFTVHVDNIYPPPMLSTIDRICLHTPIPPLPKSPALNESYPAKAGIDEIKPAVLRINRIFFILRSL